MQLMTKRMKQASVVLQLPYLMIKGRQYLQSVSQARHSGSQKNSYRIH